MDHVLNPFILYSALALGAVGVALALPRRGVSPQIIGALLAGAAGGLVVLFMTLRALVSSEGLPNVFFYVFSAIALGASLRVITHPRPVYAALYFILTVLSSAGMYLILSAEFMAFALVIIYAGAILITYLFVIMLATQSPTEEAVEVLAEYDSVSREPVAATIAGFALLAMLTSMLFAGASSLPGQNDPKDADRMLADLPRRVEVELREAGVIDRTDRIARDPATGHPLIDAEHRTARIEDASGKLRAEPVKWPADLSLRNVEGVAFNLLDDHPGSIEIAGVILLMAMLGAVVLARRKVQLDEDDKRRQAARLSNVEGGRS